MGKAVDFVIDKVFNVVKKLVGGAKAAVKEIVLRFTKKKSVGAGHQTWVDESGEPQVASTAMTLAQRVAGWRTRVKSLDSSKQATAKPKLDALTGINTDLKAAAKRALDARKAKNAAVVDAEQAKIDTAQAQMTPILAELFLLFGDTATQAGAEDEAKMFAMVEAYDKVVVPLKAKKLVEGSPRSIFATFKARWNRKNIAAARGFVTHMEQVLPVAKNVGTNRYPQLSGVEVSIEGTRIDYTTVGQEAATAVQIDIATEVKHWGAMRDREVKVKPKKGETPDPTAPKTRIKDVDEQIRERIATITNQIDRPLKDPKYKIVRVEIRGWNNMPDDLKNKLTTLFSAREASAPTMSPPKKFEWRKI